MFEIEKNILHTFSSDDGLSIHDTLDEAKMWLTKRLRSSLSGQIIGLLEDRLESCDMSNPLP